MDNEEILLQITETLREHNRQHEKVDHAETVRKIRDIVTPKGKWMHYACSRCNTYCSMNLNAISYCPTCGAKMEEYR